MGLVGTLRASPGCPEVPISNSPQNHTRSHSGGSYGGGKDGEEEAARGGTRLVRVFR